MKLDLIQLAEMQTYGQKVTFGLMLSSRFCVGFWNSSIGVWVHLFPLIVPSGKLSDFKRPVVINNKSKYKTNSSKTFERIKCHPLKTKSCHYKTNHNLLELLTSSGQGRGVTHINIPEEIWIVNLRFIDLDWPCKYHSCVQKHESKS